jgi:hypothetical protein
MEADAREWRNARADEFQAHDGDVAVERFDSDAIATVPPTGVYVRCKPLGEDGARAPVGR